MKAKVSMNSSAHRNAMPSKRQAYSPARGKAMYARLFRALALFSILVLALSASLPSYAASGLSHCKADVARLCPGIQPGGGKIIACLKEHKDDVSIGCGKALQAMKANMGK
jgi:hypothetical protein